MRNVFVAETVREGRDFLRVVNFYLKEQAPMIPGSSFLDVPDEIFYEFKNDVFMGKKIVINRKKANSGKFEAKDFRFKRTTKFEQEKQTLLNAVRNRITGVAVSTSFFEIYEFITVTGMLASQGIFLTDENREKTYLNIINTGNEDLINALERYLEIKDSMDQLFRKYKDSAEKYKRIEATTNKDELKAVTDIWGE